MQVEKDLKSMQVEKDQLYTLSRELLGTRVPSSSYPMFLFEQFIWFKLRAFSSFVRNHVQWERYLQNFSHNEAHYNLWI